MDNKIQIVTVGTGADVATDAVVFDTTTLWKIVQFTARNILVPRAFNQTQGGYSMFKFGC